MGSSSHKARTAEPSYFGASFRTLYGSQDTMTVVRTPALGWPFLLVAIVATGFGALFAHRYGSLAPLVLIGLALAAFESAYRTVAVGEGRAIPHTTIMICVLAAIGIANLSVVERITFFNASNPPAWMFSRHYGDGEYSINEHRHMRMRCESVDAFQERLYIDGEIRLRCGLLFPGAFTMSAPADAFEAVEAKDVAAGSPLFYVVDTD